MHHHFRRRRISWLAKKEASASVVSTLDLDFF
jgi:hypothetical protein